MTANFDAMNRQLKAAMISKLTSQREVRTTDLFAKLQVAVDDRNFLLAKYEAMAKVQDCAPLPGDAEINPREKRDSPQFPAATKDEMRITCWHDASDLSAASDVCSSDEVNSAKKKKVKKRKNRFV
eukprot:TRINITY_DN30873_c0_g1_i1.p1 TRINITY_DN30873_c0_g1~~TRINITY_DN30873_c0_g1_i1.p1  ORF type:complete len:126 (+),score=34.27 TRINITY_DN30873_c0_g1_i1:589-966(+)